MLIAKQIDIKYHFWIFGMTQPGIESRSPGVSVNNLPTSPVGWYK